MKEFRDANCSHLTTIRWLGHLPVLCLAVAWLVGAGCQRLKQSSSNTVAAVTIANHSFPEIAGAAEAVFTKHEFHGGRTGSDQLTFQRPGSTMDALVYGDWIDRKVTLRVVLNVQTQAADSSVVTCDARLVAAPGDPVFEENYKVPTSVKTQCQDMLNEIKTRLDQNPNGSVTEKKTTP